MFVCRCSYNAKIGRFFGIRKPVDQAVGLIKYGGRRRRRAVILRNIAIFLAYANLFSVFWGRRGWGVMESTLQRGDRVTECTPSYSIIKTAQPLSGVSQPLMVMPYVTVDPS